MSTTADQTSASLQTPSPSAGRRIRDLRPTHSSSPDHLEVVHLTAECWPFARTGGLGEAVAGLAAFQAASGVGVAVVMPLYRRIRENVTDLQIVGAPFTVRIGACNEEVQLFRTSAQLRKPRVFFIGHAACFDREGIYGEAGLDYPDNARRFALFSIAAIAALSRIAPRANIVHAHDWHSAIALAELRSGGAARPLAPRLATVLSVHNGGFQGNFLREALTDFGLADELHHARAFDAGRLNFLEIGLSHSDLIVTVSPTHARELCTREGGFGLHETFAALGNRLVGVANGIDPKLWDPANDQALPVRYTAADLAGKSACKAALQRSCGLDQTSISPLFAMCTRLAQQKGLDLILAADLRGQSDAQFVFVGRGDARYERALAELAAAAPGRIALRLDFSDELEHRVLAGADALLMPSFYEPCGLTQMRAQRYGTIPIARRVGGLADSIDDGLTGFLFGDYTRDAFLASIHLATERYEDTGRWRAMMRRAMARDFGWQRAADTYVALYRREMSVATRTIAPDHIASGAGG
ncbi:MAG: glycogen synthase [Gemmatimonadaceae bacterium]